MRLRTWSSFLYYLCVLLSRPVDSLYDLSLQITETQMVPYKRGDIINNDIVIEERIDILGSTEMVTMPVYNNNDFFEFTQEDEVYNALDHTQMLLDSGPQLLYITAGLDAADSGNNYLALLKDERVKANSTCIRNQTFCLEELYFKGGHGEVYRAHRISDLIINKNVSLILKRMFIKDRPAIERCAYREIFYGTMLTNNFLAGTNVARFQSYFTTTDEIWLVFLNEGVSLQSFLYIFDKSETGNAVMRASQLWINMKKRTDNYSFIRVMMYQLIKSVAELHERGIIHRDLKPGNLIINSDHDSPRLLLADFSSAIGGTDEDLYGGFGPLIDEETLSYAPPEVLFSIATSKELPFEPTNPKSYDVWSCGIIMLELILGTSNVFSLSERSTRKVSRSFQKSGNINNQKEINDALLTEALKEYCILDTLDAGGTVPRISQSNNRDRDLAPVCNIADAIFNRDPLKIGFRDHEGIDLLAGLLQFNPHDRITLQAALDHAYFQER